MQMETFTKETGRMIKLMAMVATFIQRTLCMRVIGTMINRTGMEKRHGLMVHHMKETTKKGRRKEMEFSSGLTAQSLKDNFLITIFMAMESMFGQTKEYIKENG